MLSIKGPLLSFVTVSRNVQFEAIDHILLLQILLLQILLLQITKREVKVFRPVAKKF